MLVFLNLILLACVLLASTAISDLTDDENEDPSTLSKLPPSGQLYDFGFTPLSRQRDPCDNFYDFVCFDPLERYLQNEKKKRFRKNGSALKADIEKSPDNYHPPIGSAYMHTANACLKLSNGGFLAEHVIRTRELFDRANRTHLSLTDLMLDVAPYPLFYGIIPKKIIEISINYKDLSIQTSENLTAAISRVVDMSRNISQFFDKALANETQNSTIQTTVGELRQLFTAVDWIQYFTKILPDEVHSNLTEAGMTVADLSVMVPNLQALKTYDRALKSLTYDQIVSAAAMILLTREMLSSTKCLQIHDLYFNDFTSRVYADRHYVNRAAIRSTVLDMTENIRREFAVQINASSWMNATGKAAALRKLSLINVHVGAYDPVFNDSALMELYSDLNATDILATKSPLDVIQKLVLLTFRRLFAIELPSYRFHFITSSIAQYNPLSNEFQINTEYLNEPFFGVDRPLASNYGMIGFVLAHEIGHAFGKYHDYDGPEHLKIWWNETVFQKRAKCFSKQYEDHRIYNMTLNASDSVLEENLADDFGVRVAYGAFKRLLTEDPRRGDPRIRGFEHLDAYQQFFYSHAMFHCDKVGAKELVSWMAKSAHPPPQARVNLRLANSMTFGAAFKCRLGTAMNPVEKCPPIF